MVKPEIALLSQETIDKIAAGEVVERPSSVVKELVENAIDANATAITVEIKDGGSTMIRITDNGWGIAKDQLSLAFLRHSTSKITTSDDLRHVKSLGFRGEALSSIAAVSRVELITKPKDQLMGARYVIEGGIEQSIDDIGAPNGTSFLIRDIFYNTPARRKFLKSAVTETGYISDITERLALSHPNIAIRFIANGKTRLATAGNGNLKDTIYQIYGRDVARELLEVHYAGEDMTMTGFIGKPVVTRGNRNFENFFIEGRYVHSKIFSKAIEEGYKGYLMQHQYPFCVLFFDFHSDVDVNVHPTKMEVRFEQEQQVYENVFQAIRTRLMQREDIADVPVHSQKPITAAPPPAKIDTAEPFERRRLEQIKENVTASIRRDTPYERKYAKPYSEQAKSIRENTDTAVVKEEPLSRQMPQKENPVDHQMPQKKNPVDGQMLQKSEPAYEQLRFLSEEAVKEHRIIGQLFDTYWMVEFDNSLYIIDQHAAHEKVLYEKLMATLKERDVASQMISPSIIVNLSATEEIAYEEYADVFRRLGFTVEPFGTGAYAITGVPDNMLNVDPKELFMEMLAGGQELKGAKTSDIILEKAASMSCKAAVKGNMHLSRPEIEQLITDLLSLENPYHCPHGRPTIIKMTKYEIEKKFKRIV